MNDKQLKLRLYITCFLAYAALACYSPFLIIYFNNRNLSYIQTGIAFAVLPLIGVISQPVWGFITDKYLNKKITLLILISSSAVSILLLAFVNDFYSILLCIILLALFITSVFSILDALCCELAASHHDIQFSRARLAGSLGYGLFVFIMGIIIKHTNINVSFYICCFLNIIAVTVLWTIRYEENTAVQRINVRDVVNLLKNKNFAVFIISVMLINISIGANSSYIGELIRYTGGDVSNLGLLWFVVAFCEVPVLYVGTRILAKYKDLRLYYIATISYALRFFLNSMCTSWKMVILVQMLQCVTFALYVISALHFLDRVIPPKMKTTGITIYAALGGGLGGFIGNMGGGMVLQSLDITWLYKILSLVCLVSLFTSFFIERRYRLKHPPAHEHSL